MDMMKKDKMMMMKKDMKMMSQPVIKSEVDKAVFDPKGKPVKGFKKMMPVSKESLMVKF